MGGVRRSPPLSSAALWEGDHAGEQFLCFPWDYGGGGLEAEPARTSCVPPSDAKGTRC